MPKYIFIILISFNLSAMEIVHSQFHTANNTVDKITVTVDEHKHEESNNDARLTELKMKCRNNKLIACTAITSALITAGVALIIHFTNCGSNN